MVECVVKRGVGIIKSNQVIDFDLPYTDEATHQEEQRFRPVHRRLLSNLRKHQTIL